MMKRGILVMMLVCIFVVGLVMATAHAKELKIGVLGPLSGPVAFAGKTVLNSAMVAADEVNAAGGVRIAGETYKIKLIGYDTKYAVQPAKRAAERLIFEDKVKFIIGALSLDTRGFQGVSEKNKVIIMPLGGSIFADPKKPYTFRITGLVDAKYVGVYTYIQKNMPYLKAVSFINPDTPVGEAYSGFSRKAAEPLGFKVLGSEFIALGGGDFTPVLTKVLGKKPDIIDLGATGGGSDSALLIKQARELGFKGQMVAAVGLQSKTVMQVVGPTGMEGVIETGFTPDDPALSPGFKKFAMTYTKRFPKLPFIDLCSEAYDSTLAFFKFLNGQDTMDTSVLKDRFGNYVWNGIYGKTYFGGKKTYGIKRQKVQPLYLSRWKNGKPSIISTVDAPVP
ncbi:ABC transporter substrate-binding protein [Thermodesulfobacteriota bacterium]